LGPTWGRGRRVVTVHDVIFRRYPEDYNKLWLAITRALLPRVLAGASAIIADSETTRADMARFYRVRPERVTVIYPGIDDIYRKPVLTALLESVLEELKLSGKRYIICLGPWVQRKNLGVVVEAFQIISEQIENIVLVITGKPAAGMQGANLQAL